MASIDNIIDKIRGGERLTFQDGLSLYHYSDLPLLGKLAHSRRLKQKPDTIVTYIIDRNINYTNVCVAQCSFCAFYRKPGDPESYTLSQEQLDRKIEETLGLQGIQILLQGGLNPKLHIDYYEDLLRHIKSKFPTIHIHGFSPPEILFISRLDKISVQDVIRRLVTAGLDSIPGGGAEILTDAIRQEIAPNKYTPDEWLDVMRQAHILGLRTTATMMFGSIEQPEDRMEHILRIRELQDEHHGFTAFIPWAFQPENSPLGERVNYVKVTPSEYLRMVAISRLMLDNVENIQASWVTMGAQVAQNALFYGANDFGSLMIEENVVRLAGTSFRMSVEQMENVIRDAGFEPHRRNQRYELIPIQPTL